MILAPQAGQANWTGIGVFVGQGESDWRYGGQLRQARLNQYGLYIEEKTQVNLRVGASAGQFSLRLFDLGDPTLAHKYYGQFLSFYLRMPVKLNKVVSLHTRLNYQYNLGDKKLETEKAEISWNEVSLDVGVSFRFGPLAVRPFMNFRTLDGDTSSASVARLFELDKHRSSGLALDYLLDPTAYIRVSTTFESNRSLQINFVREI